MSRHGSNRWKDNGGQTAVHVRQDRRTADRMVAKIAIAPQVPLGRLRELALQARWDGGLPTTNASERSVRRWMAGYARHNLSNYDRVMHRIAVKLSGSALTKEACWRAKVRVLDLTAQAWPELSDVCETEKIRAPYWARDHAQARWHRSLGRSRNATQAARHA